MVGCVVHKSLTQQRSQRHLVHGATPCTSSDFYATKHLPNAQHHTDNRNIRRDASKPPAIYWNLSEICRSFILVYFSPFSYKIHLQNVNKYTVPLTLDLPFRFFLFSPFLFKFRHGYTTIKGMLTRTIV